ncbi:MULTISPECIES: ABC transporter permease [unclassified Streptomyces]|uniref:ABC transporter permease n=1 Tax=unclassified Streptomyces TaxID=2593676 RepID=UPI00224F85F7|nr:MULTISPECIES: ABC transporter permease [unclassified Streptomyces]MCX5144002.1 ABC transporter permease [Streptomyces sp. NBC_00338]WRZ68388.1 ABC transporter permease [Streptomyces sp. NBC_01257]
MRLRPPRAPRGERSHLSRRDLLSECAAGILQRPARSALTALGTVLGVGTFVVVLGLTATTSSQIDSRFNELTATQVTVEDTGGEQPEYLANAFPADADRRIEALNGVRNAGVYWPVRLTAEELVSAAPPGTGDEGERTEVVAASPGVLEAAGPDLEQGRIFDAYHDRRGENVAVIGSGLAARLGITTLETAPAVFVGDHAFTVIGIVADVERKADLLLSVVVPRTTAERIWGGPDSGARAQMLIATDLGAARQIASEAPLALDPAHLEYFKAVPPPDPRGLRGSVTSDLDELFMLLAGICLVIGAVGIANTTLVAVLERTGEIGLRRALGARGRHITLQFLAESGALGALGGLVGTSIGTVTVVAMAVVRDWTPVIHPATVVAAPAIGLVTGVLAGLYPAWRASRIQPAEALRR